MYNNVWRMSDHFGEEGRRSMPGPDREFLERFVTLLEKADYGGTAGVPEELLTKHRRGHWFKSSTAH